MQATNLTSAVLVAVVLVACSISGLAAGVFAGHLGDLRAAASHNAPAPASSHTPPAAATATPVPEATATATPRPAGNVAFVLSVSSSPQVLPAGQSFTVTVTALTPQGGAAIGGLQCFMRAPSDGRTPLFQEWPPSQVTGSNGQATWRNLTAPQVAPGTYGLEVVAYGANSYYRYADTFVTISG
jgi:hypothetical protein